MFTSEKMNFIISFDFFIVDSVLEELSTSLDYNLKQTQSEQSLKEVKAGVKRDVSFIRKSLMQPLGTADIDLEAEDMDIDFSRSSQRTRNPSQKANGLKCSNWEQALKDSEQMCASMEKV